MIISRAPLRITLAGGGTDLPSFSDHFGGKVLSAAINKYVYVSVIRPFDKSIILKYSQNENVNNIKDIKHIFLKKILEKFKISKKIEITTLADIPSGTGLGSSGSFSVALLSEDGVLPDLSLLLLRLLPLISNRDDEKSSLGQVKYFTGFDLELDFLARTSLLILYNFSVMEI